MMVEEINILNILKVLREDGKMSITKLYQRLSPISYYKLKLEYIPQLEKRGDVLVTKNGNHTYIELNERGLE